MNSLRTTIGNKKENKPLQGGQKLKNWSSLALASCQ